MRWLLILAVASLLVGAWDECRIVWCDDDGCARPVWCTIGGRRR